MGAIKIAGAQFDAEVKQAQGTVIVDFYADWCGPCKMLGPVLDQIADEKGVKVVKINVDDDQEMAMAHGVMSVPTVYIFKDGEEAGKFVGVRGKADIEKML